MKKLLFTAAVVAMGLTTVNAQEVKFGAKAGVNLANIGGDAEDVDMLTSFHVGGVAEIVLSDKFSVQPELMYSAQGAKNEYTETFLGETVKYESKLKLDYINLPIMAKYYVAEGLSLEAGPQVSFLVSAEEEYKASYEGESETETYDLKDEIKSIDFGVGFGAGYKLESGLNFSARYNLGLSNIADGEGDEDYSIQNNVIQVSVGYSFN